MPRPKTGPSQRNAANGPSPRRSGAGAREVWRWAALAVVAFAFMAVAWVAREFPATGKSVGIGNSAPAALVRAVTGVPLRIFAEWGVRQAMPAELVRGKPTDAPGVFYVGAEGCPYCAAERWAIVVALSRFGRWSGLRLMRSSGDDSFPGTPTFSFFRARFHSRYVTAALMETAGRRVTASGFGPTLARLTPAESLTFHRLDAPPYIPPPYRGVIPFLLVGGRYLWVGSGFSPALLDGKSWAEVGAAVRSGRGPLARAVLSNAEAIAAAVCAVDGGRPRPVCRMLPPVPTVAVRVAP
jgi:hypothetical protein